MTTGKKIVKAVPVVKAVPAFVEVSKEQKAAILAEGRAAILAEEKERVSAAKLAGQMARLLPGLQDVPCDDNDAQFNCVSKGYYGLSSGTSVAWSVVQVAGNYRYRFGFGEIFGVGGCTGLGGADMMGEGFEADGMEWSVEGGFGETMAHMRIAVRAAIKAGRVYIVRPSKAALKAAALKAATLKA